MGPLEVFAVSAGTVAICGGVEMTIRWWVQARKNRARRLDERAAILRLADKAEPNPGLAAKRGTYFAGNPSQIIDQLTRSEGHRGSRA